MPNGRAEAARALGSSGWRVVWQIVLPQAIGKVVLPPTSTAIVKNASLILIVGVFDMLSAGRAAATDRRHRRRPLRELHRQRTLFAVAGSPPRRAGRPVSAAARADRLGRSRRGAVVGSQVEAAIPISATSRSMKRRTRGSNRRRLG